MAIDNAPSTDVVCRLPHQQAEILALQAFRSDRLACDELLHRQVEIGIGQHAPIDIRFRKNRIGIPPSSVTSSAKPVQALARIMSFMLANLRRDAANYVSGLSRNDKSVSGAEKRGIGRRHTWCASRRKEDPPLKPAPSKANPIPRVLIVDDAGGMRAYLRIILSAAGFDCHEAADGAEGFEKVMNGGIDLVVTDLDMPVMDGFALLSAISLLSVARGRPPVIVVSGLLDETLAERRPELRSAVALLAKPVQPADLLKAVARAMGIRAQID